MGLDSLGHCHIHLSSPLTYSPLGLGNNKTWHGTPDGQMRGVMICLQDQDEESESESEDGSIASESDGMTTNMEAKIHLKASNLPQVVATTVVSSFTETANHLNKSPLIPTEGGWIVFL